MIDEKIKESIAPCGLCCETCFAHVDGDIRKYSMKLKEKLGADFRRYVILGACNPSLAYKTLQGDINIGLLLPCNVIVYDAGRKNSSVVAVIDAKAMMSVAGEGAEIEKTASEVNELLQKALKEI